MHLLVIVVVVQFGVAPVVGVVILFVIRAFNVLAVGIRTFGMEFFAYFSGYFGSLKGSPQIRRISKGLSFLHNRPTFFSCIQCLPDFCPQRPN